MRPVAHRDDELHADEQDASIAENYENNCSDIVAERIGFRICQRSSYEIECKVEVGLTMLAFAQKHWTNANYQREKGEQKADELVDEFDV